MIREFNADRFVFKDGKLFCHGVGVCYLQLLGPFILPEGTEWVGFDGDESEGVWVTPEGCSLWKVVCHRIYSVKDWDSGGLAPMMSVACIPNCMLTRSELSVLLESMGCNIKVN